LPPHLNPLPIGERGRVRGERIKGKHSPEYPGGCRMGIT